MTDRPTPATIIGYRRQGVDGMTYDLTGAGWQRLTLRVYDGGRYIDGPRGLGALSVSRDKPPEGTRRRVLALVDAMAAQTYQQDVQGRMSIRHLRTLRDDARTLRDDARRLGAAHNVLRDMGLTIPDDLAKARREVVLGLHEAECASWLWHAQILARAGIASDTRAPIQRRLTALHAQASRRAGASS
jgi:hypothetical protein